MSFTVRKAGPDDIRELIPLLKLLFTIEEDFVFNEDIHTKGLSLLFQEPDDKAVVLVAESDGKIVGMVTAQITVSTAAGGFSAWMEDLVVDRDYQGRGIGQKLTEEILVWCREKGCLRVQLLADKDNFPALEFYRKDSWEGSNMIPLKKFL